MKEYNGRMKRKAWLSVLGAIIILVAAQGAAALVGSALVFLRLPAWCGNVAAAVLYVVFALWGIRFWTDRLYGGEETGMKSYLGQRVFEGGSIRPVWLLASFAMPMLTCIILVLMPGHWENAAINSQMVTSVITGGVLNYGVAAGIVEEAVFRGVIMAAVELGWNRKAAILAPSVLFAVMHIIGSGLDIVSMIQVVVAGSLVGILFSLVTYVSGNIWNSAVMHGIWNIFMISGVLHIGIEVESETLFNYVLDTRAFLITGGGFGAEASVAAVLAYGVFCVLAVYLSKKEG